MKKRSNGCTAKERLLEHTLSQLNAFSDGIDEPIYVIDPDTYKILFANKKTENLFGKDATGKKCFRVFQKLNAPCPNCSNKYVFGENLGKTYHWDHQNGWNKRWYRGIYKAIKWPSGKYVKYGMSIDITEQKKMEEALRESEDFFRTVVNNSHNGILILDDNFRIIYVNDEITRIGGYSKKEIIGHDFREFLVSGSMMLAEDRYLSRQRGENAPAHYEIKVVKKNGEERTVEIKSSVVKYRCGRKCTMAQLIDVTERKRMEEERKHFEERLSSLNTYGQSLNMAKNMDVIYRLILDGMERTLGFEFADVFIVEGKMLQLKAHRGHSKDLSLELPMDGKKGITVRAVKSARSVFVPNVCKDKAYVEGGEGIRSELAVPIKVGNKVLGVLNVEGKSPAAFSNEDTKLLEILASHAAIAITNLKRQTILSALNEYGQNLNMAQNMDEIYTLTQNAMETILRFEYASILAVEGGKLRLAAHHGYTKKFDLLLPLDENRGVTVKAARLGRPVLVPNIRKEKAYIKGGDGMLSELAVPIIVGNKILGVLNVESKKLAAFDQNDIELLEILASHVAIATTNLTRQGRLSALNEYGRSLNMAKNMEEVYALTLDAMGKTLGFEFATFFVVEGRELRLVAHLGYPKEFSVSLPLDGDKGVSVKAVKLGKPIFVPDVRAEKTYVPGRPGMLSELAVPIRIGNRVLGVLNVESERLAAFDENDRELFEILACHAATAMSTLKRRDQLKQISSGLEHLMRNTTEIMHIKDMHKRLSMIAKTIQRFGWRRVVISLRDENLEGIDLVAAGLTKDEVKLLMERKAPGRIWRDRLGPKFERFRLGGFYCLPWMDPWVRENVHGVPPETSPDEATTYAGVPSRLSPDEMVDWHPQDMLYAPLRTPEGRIVGILSMDDPVNGRRPNKESLTPLELFLHQAAMIIENAQLVEGLREARELLEQKVEERTRELRESQGQLLKAQRLAVIGELAGMVGHDLRNPLTSIAGATYYLKKREATRNDEKIREMLELIENNITYSNKIISDLLDYSREIKLDLVESEPKTIMKEALSHIEIPKKIKLVDLTENTPRMKVDLGKLTRALINIIKNAVDAMPKGGTLTIQSRKLNGNVLFTFSDTGVGMSKENLQALWTPLFTTKAKGMGFGLSICKRIIDAHGGSISAESVLRKGTVFKITIPIEPTIAEEGGEKIWVKTPESSLLTTTKT
jgi:PAS domain S-box-containing protein